MAETLYTALTTHWHSQVTKCALLHSPQKPKILGGGLLIAAWHVCSLCWLKSLCLTQFRGAKLDHMQSCCLQAVGDIEVPLDSRKELYKHLSGQGFSEGLQQWLGSNLVSVQDGLTDDKPRLTWTFNLAGAHDMYRQVYARHVRLNARSQLVSAYVSTTGGQVLRVGVSVHCKTTTWWQMRPVFVGPKNATCTGRFSFVCHL